MWYAVTMILASVSMLAQGVTSEHQLQLFNQSSPATRFRISAPTSASYTLTLPQAQGGANTLLTAGSGGVLSWSLGAPSSLSSLGNATVSNDITSGSFPQTWTWNSLAGTTALTISDKKSSPSPSTTSYGLDISGNSGLTSDVTSRTRHLLVENSHTGTSSTNVGIDVAATGGTFNIALFNFYGRSGFLLGTDVNPGERMHIGAGTATLAPLKFTSGTNLAAAEQSSVEYDGNVFYVTNDTAARGVLPSKYFVILDANNTLTNQTAAQPIFDGGGGSATGAIDLPAGLYEFEMLIHLTGLNAAAGSIDFTFAGTATRNSLSWKSCGGRYADVALANNLAYGVHNTARTTPASLSGASQGNTAGWYYVNGIVRLSAAGTLIPSIGFQFAAAAVVQTNSYFKISKLGSSTSGNVGRWK